MAKYCPVSKTKVLYLECLECDEHECESMIRTNLDDETDDAPYTPNFKKANENTD